MLEDYLGPTHRQIIALERTDIYQTALKLDFKMRSIFHGLENPRRIKNISKFFVKQAGVTVPLLTNAYITQPHESSTRYVFKGKSPSERYNSEHSIIRLLPKMHTISEKGLNNLDDLFKSYRRFSYDVRWLDSILTDTKNPKPRPQLRYPYINRRYRYR